MTWSTGDGIRWYTITRGRDEICIHIFYCKTWSEKSHGRPWRRWNGNMKTSWLGSEWVCGRVCYQVQDLWLFWNRLSMTFRDRMKGGGLLAELLLPFKWGHWFIDLIGWLVICLLVRRHKILEFFCIAVMKQFYLFIESETIFSIAVACFLNWSSLVKGTANRGTTALNSVIQTHLESYVTAVGAGWKERESLNCSESDRQQDWNVREAANIFVSPTFLPSHAVLWTAQVSSEIVARTQSPPVLFAFIQWEWDMLHHAHYFHIPHRFSLLDIFWSLAATLWGLYI